MFKPTHINTAASLLFLSSLFSATLSADILNGTHWVIESGDSLYKIARTLFPNSAKQQAKLRRELMRLNPQVFAKGASNISVGDKLKIPAFAVAQSKSAPVIVAKKPEPIVKIKAPPKPKKVAVVKTQNEALATPDPEDVVGKVIINVGNLNAQNRGVTRQLKRRSPIFRGDTLSTGGHSLTQIRMKDGALISLRPHTDLRIVNYQYNGQEDGSEQSIIELLKGGFRTITGIIGHKNKNNYQVRSSVATIGIRGTHYSLVLCQQSSCSSDESGEIEDGLYGGVADGSIILENETGTHQFNNDQYFKLTSASTAPEAFLFPPAVLKHDAAMHNTAKQKKQNLKHSASKKIKAAPRRLAVIIEASQPDFRRRPKLPTPDTNQPPITEFQPELAPNGSAVLVGFNEVDASGAITASGGGVIIAANNDNRIVLGANRTPIALREISTNAVGELVENELSVVSPSGLLATLVPSSVGGNAALGVNWGRWNGDFTIRENGVLINTKNNLHYIYSENLTSPAQLANLGGLGGQVSYGLNGGTLPSDNLGNVAVESPFINMSVDFIRQQITQYDVSAVVNGSVYEASASNIAFQNLNNSFDLQSISVGCSSVCVGDASVLFVGAQAEGAITTYQISDPNGTASITGTALLTQGGVGQPAQ